MHPYTRKHRIMQITALYLGALALIAYFSYNSWSGSYGLKAKKQYEQEVIALKLELAKTKGEREKIAQRISLLHPDTIDPDMLEERAREVLNYVHPQEVILFRK